MRLIVLTLIIFVLAQAAYGAESCFKESAQFANCVDRFLLENVKRSKAEELEAASFKACLKETKEYQDCGNINKTEYAQAFVRGRISYFTRSPVSAANTPEKNSVFR